MIFFIINYCLHLSSDQVSTTVFIFREPSFWDGFSILNNFPYIRIGSFGIYIPKVRGCKINLGGDNL